MAEMVVLVDEHDRQLGLMEKLEAHEKGLLHRAISVLVFNRRGELLIQQRALGKYHWPGIWANTCCTHPRSGESYAAAAHRRLDEEMGFSCALKDEFSFVYRAVFENGLIEHELDHVFSGVFDGDPSPDPDEVASFAWVEVASLREDVARAPDKYAPWFRIILDRYFG
jgi:isopentenyl-diphosphate Delta-isomerase